MYRCQQRLSIFKSFKCISLFPFIMQDNVLFFMLSDSVTYPRPLIQLAYFGQSKTGVKCQSYKTDINLETEH